MKKWLICLLVLLTVFIPGVAMAAGDLIPTMTSNLSPSGVASCSTIYNIEYYDAYKAFDDIDDQRGWVSAGSMLTGWLAYEFANPIIINKYTLMSRAPAGDPAEMPKDWNFEGWNGSNWIVLDTRSNITGWQSSIKKEFTFTNAAAYSKYRINIFANNGQDNYTGIGEMEMMEELSAPAAPENLSATAGNSQVNLSWTAVTGATSYNIKRATTAGGPYTSIATSVSSAVYTDTSVTNGTTYYYVVTAINSGGESDNSNEASAIPQAPASGNNVLFVITMTNGTEREYELSITNVDAFISWYNGRASGSGNAYYIFNKSFNKGPFTSRKDYIVFDKILSFEVMEY